MVMMVPLERMVKKDLVRRWELRSFLKEMKGLYKASGKEKTEKKNRQHKAPECK